MGGIGGRSAGVSFRTWVRGTNFSVAGGGEVTVMVAVSAVGFRAAKLNGLFSCISAEGGGEGWLVAASSIADSVGTDSVDPIP